ncbi:MAG: hypothetical protein ACXQT3_01275 [Methermicoccaceae archaeon]
MLYRHGYFPKTRRGVDIRKLFENAVLTVCELESPSELRGLRIPEGRSMRGLCHVNDERVLNASMLSDALAEGKRVVVGLVKGNVVSSAVLSRTSDGYELEGVYAHSRYFKYGGAVVLLSACLDGLDNDVSVHPEREVGMPLFSSLSFLPQDVQRDAKKLVLLAAATNGLLIKQSRRHPRMFFPELFDLYERLILKQSLGRTLKPEELQSIKRMVSRSGSLLPSSFVMKLKELLALLESQS